MDLYVGFMYMDRSGRVFLVLDLVEEFCLVLVDCFVLILVNIGVVKSGDFEIWENGGVLLFDFGWKKVFMVW